MTRHEQAIITQCQQREKCKKGIAMPVDFYEHIGHWAEDGKYLDAGNSRIRVDVENYDECCDGVLCAEYPGEGGSKLKIYPCMVTETGRDKPQ